MSDKKFFRWTGIALIGAGVAIAIFWLMVLPFKSFAGPEAPLDSLFVPGQVFHVLGAGLAVFGYFGIYLKQKESSGTWGTVGFVIAVIGMMFFLADAMIGIVVFPALAEYAPEMTDAAGPLFTGRALGFYIMFSATNMTGIVILALATLRAKVMPKMAAVLFLVGGIMFNLPPMPALHFVLIAGGVIWGSGAVWLGQALAREKE
jgi:hypothetical protein